MADLELYCSYNQFWKISHEDPSKRFYLSIVGQQIRSFGHADSEEELVEKLTANLKKKEEQVGWERIIVYFADAGFLEEAIARDKNILHSLPRINLHRHDVDITAPYEIPFLNRIQEEIVRILRKSA